MRWGWLALAVLSGIAVFFVTNIYQGVCMDSGTDPAASSCESAPLIGWPAVWIAWIVWILLAGYCMWRAVRPAPKTEER